MKHRARKSRLRLVATGVALPGILLLLAWPFLTPSEAGRSRVRTSASAPIAPVPAVRPTSRASPEYLTQSYRAPPTLVRAGAGGNLRIPSLGVSAFVDAVGLDGTAMAVPDDPARVGWLTSTARADDLVGASVLAGHVSDRHDRPGALARLDRIRRGARIIWTDARGAARTFRVIRTQLFPRSLGLPEQMFGTDGPHRLYLVTCAQREATGGGGFHYRSNLVVTAVR